MICQHCYKLEWVVRNVCWSRLLFLPPIAACNACLFQQCLPSIMDCFRFCNHSHKYTAGGWHMINHMMNYEPVSNEDFYQLFLLHNDIKLEIFYIVLNKAFLSSIPLLIIKDTLFFTQQDLIRFNWNILFKQNLGSYMPDLSLHPPPDKSINSSETDNKEPVYKFVLLVEPEFPQQGINKDLSRLILQLHWWPFPVCRLY